MTTATAVKTYDFSWARQARTFRFVAGAEELFADRSKGFEGLVYIEEANPQTGHMRLTCNIERLNSGEWVLYNPDLLPVDAPADAESADLWQVCFARKTERWRIWDKTTPKEKDEDVLGYTGPAYVVWHDGGGHIYVRGRRWKRDGIVYFAGDR